MLRDLLLPRTDAAVLVQVGVFLAVVAIALWRTWRQPDLRRLVLGMGMLGLGLMALRAAH